MKSENIVSNFIWRFAERCGAQLVSFIVSIVLARILAPEDYGTIALVTVFTAILQVFVDSGLGTALIQKKDADDLDFSSVFYFNFAVCLILYAGMFIAAPYIAIFYSDATLTSVIRVLSLTIVISGVKGIQQAYVSRNMLFKRFFFSTIGGTIFSAFLGIGLAYVGYGVWALVAQQLSNTMIDTLILWITVKWRPTKEFSWKRLRTLFSFGWKLIIVTNINTSIDSVLLPTMSNEQDDRNRIKSMTRRAIKTSTYVMAPLMMGLAFCAESIVKIVLTDKWLPCVPFLRLFCISYMFWPVHTANLNAIKAMGRSDWFLKLEIVKKSVGLFFLLSSMWFGVMAMAYSLLLSSILSQAINAWPNRKLLGYGYLEQVRDFAPGVLLAVGMGICVYLIGVLSLPTIVTLLIQVVVGAVIYIGVSALLKLEAFEYLLGMVKSFFKK